MTPREPCICGREPRGFWFRKDGIEQPACSMTCLNIIVQSKGKPDMQISYLEAECIQETSEMIGGHLEALGKTDMAAMTGEEWLDFLAAAYSAINARVRERLESGEMPV